MRVAFFNDLDSYALKIGIESSTMIKGVSLDPRIGQHYNTPSLGVGGHCLPKDAAQLMHDLRQVPQSTVTAVNESNEHRARTLASDIASETTGTIGFYSSGSPRGNQDQLSRIARYVPETRDLISYGPGVRRGERMANLEEFKQRSSLIVADLIDDLTDVSYKVYGGGRLSL